MEIFHGPHYFTITGNIVQGRGTIEDCSEQLRAFLSQNGKEAREPHTEYLNPVPTRIPLMHALNIASRYYDWDNYSDWVQIGQILKASYQNDPRSLSVWNEWSSLSVKYPGEGVSFEKWKTFKRGDKTVGSLVHLEQEMLKKGILRVLPGGLRIRAGGNLDERNHPVPGKHSEPIVVIDAGDWLDEPDEPIEFILPGLLAVGDKLLICGKSKTKKTFLATQLAVCLSAGKNFLQYHVNKKWRVLIIQLEIRKGWFQRRIRGIAEHQGISNDELRGYLKVINGRGKEITVEKILEIAKAQKYKPELIILDPVYKLDDLDEADTEAWKKLLRSMDKLAEELGATPSYVHHDRKGLIADDIGDRGSGSGVIGRDWDSFIGLASHATDKQITVIEVGSRNFPAGESDVQSIEFKQGAFKLSNTPPMVLKMGTAANPTSECDLDVFLEPAIGILARGVLAPEVLKDKIKHELGLTVKRADAVFALLKGDKRVARLVGRRKKKETDLWGLKEVVELKERERSSEE